MTEGPAGYRCPTCGAPVAARDPWRPFCGERCKGVDLGAWLLGHYRIPAFRGPSEDAEDGADEDPPRPADDDDPSP